MVSVQLILIRQMFRLNALVKILLLVNIVKFHFLHHRLIIAYQRVTMVVLVLMVCASVHHTTSGHCVNIVNKKKENRKKNKEPIWMILESPCIDRNPCLNSGTCFGRYDTNGTLYTQCFCLQGYTGVYCECNINIKKDLK